MERKGQGVVLATDYGVTQEFEVSHAERLLRWKTSGWHLADTRYNYKEEYGIRPATDKEINGETY